MVFAVFSKESTNLLCNICVRRCVYIVQCSNGRKFMNTKQKCNAGRSFYITASYSRFPGTARRFYATDSTDDNSVVKGFSFLGAEEKAERKRRKLITLQTIMEGNFGERYSLQRSVSYWMFIFGNQAMTERYAEKKNYATFIANQKYSPERVKVLGPDLGAAHYLLARKGSVKLKGVEQWYTKEGSLVLPNIRVEGMFVEGICAAWTELAFEGLMNFRDLEHLKFLDISYCANIDDFCLSVLKLITPTLEFLDISGCPFVTHLGISCLYQLPNLKKVRVADNPHLIHNEKIFTKLQELRPDIEFFIDLEEDIEEGIEDIRDEEEKEEVHNPTVSAYSPNVERILHANVNTCDKELESSKDNVNIVDSHVETKQEKNE